MPAILAFAIVAISVIAITYKTYMGYGNYHWGIKLGFFLFITFGWCAPFIAFYLRHHFTNTGLIYLTKGLPQPFLWHPQIIWLSVLMVILML